MVTYPINKFTVDSVLVKLLSYDSEKVEDHGNVKGYMATFRVFFDTKFSDIKAIACKYWNLNELQYEMTDEYFCNLVTYTDNIQDFYKSQYAPLNKERSAIVYIYVANIKQIKLNFL
jgi:hypothetical protein